MSKTKLKRSLGLFEVTLSGIGIILGAGIYALIGKAAGIAGYGVWISFLIAAGIAALTGLSYAELSSMFPKAGAEYVYTNRAFGKRLGFLIGWLLVIGGLLGASTVALGFGGYLTAILGTPVLLGAILLVLAISIILYFGVKESAMAAIIGTLIEAGGLILIVLVSIPYLGSVDYFEMPEIPSILSAAALIFFAYIGFEEMSRMAEEVKDPEKNMPRGLILAIVFTSVLYALVAISAISVLTPAELGASDAPLADVAEKAIGNGSGFILAIIALFATANTVLMMQFATSRLVYGMGGKSIISKVDKNRRSPIVAIGLVTLAAICLMFLGGIEIIAYLTDFTVFMAFVAVNLSLIWLRQKEPNLKRTFKVPTLLLPVLGAVTSFAMLFTMPMEVILFGLGVLIAGLLFYQIIKKD